MGPRGERGQQMLYPPSRNIFPALVAQGERWPEKTSHWVVGFQVSGSCCYWSLLVQPNYVPSFVFCPLLFKGARLCRDGRDSRLPGEKACQVSSTGQNRSDIHTDFLRVWNVTPALPLNPSDAMKVKFKVLNIMVWPQTIEKLFFK